MDITTIAGLILGLIVLMAALLLGNVPIATLLNPEALLLVFGGTATAMLVSFPASTLSQAIAGLRRSFEQESMTARDCTEYLGEVSGFVRREGILALNPLMGGIEIPFLKKGLALLVDNRPASFVRDTLGTEIEISFRNDLDAARVFEAAGGYSPTMGIIGTVIGLIHVVQTVHDPAQLGQGVAGAFSATLYGVAFSNLFLLPLAGKLRHLAKEEWLRKTLILEGLMSIRAGDHPLIMEERLNAFVSGPEPQKPEPVATLEADLSLGL